MIITRVNIYKNVDAADINTNVITLNAKYGGNNIKVKNL